MKKYKVYAEMMTNLSIELEAENEDDAIEKALEIEGSEFIEDGLGDWVIKRAVEVQDG